MKPLDMICEYASKLEAQRTDLLEALVCTHYALTNKKSNQQFAIDAAKEAIQKILNER